MSYMIPNPQVYSNVFDKLISKGESFLKFSGAVETCGILDFLFIMLGIMNVTFFQKQIFSFPFKDARKGLQRTKSI